MFFVELYAAAKRGQENRRSSWSVKCGILGRRAKFSDIYPIGCLQNFYFYNNLHFSA